MISIIQAHPRVSLLTGLLTGIYGIGACIRFFPTSYTQKMGNTTDLVLKENGKVFNAGFESTFEHVLEPFTHYIFNGLTVIAIKFVKGVIHGIFDGLEQALTNPIQLRPDAKGLANVYAAVNMTEIYGNATDKFNPVLASNLAIGGGLTLALGIVTYLTATKLQAMRANMVAQEVLKTEMTDRLKDVLKDPPRNRTIAQTIESTG